MQESKETAPQGVDKFLGVQVRGRYVQFKISDGKISVGKNAAELLKLLGSEEMPLWKFIENNHFKTKRVYPLIFKMSKEGLIELANNGLKHGKTIKLTNLGQKIKGLLVNYEFKQNGRVVRK